MGLDHDEIAYLAAHSGAWRLLRADTAPLVLAVLGRIFVEDNVRSIGQSDLVARVDDQLYAINAAVDGAYPRTAREYVDAWARPETGWLRTYYPADSTEAHYDATTDLEKAYAWVGTLSARSFVGTESRLHTVIEVLRQMVAGADDDPARRLAELRRRRDELDVAIAEAETHGLPPLDAAALLDRYQHFSTTARELLADFREVEDNFRALDRRAREQITGWDGSKGDLLEHLVGDRHAIAGSDQGRSFQSFHDFLLSRRRQEELSDLLERLVALDDVPVDRRLRHIHHDWLDAAERTQQTVRQLSEQLRRFLDDKVWLENRRVMDLLRSIERTALALRSQPSPDVVMELDALAPQLRLPMERPLYAARIDGGLLDAPVVDADEDLDATALFDQTYVDTARLLATARTALRARRQVSLSQLLADHPPELGLAEIVAYLGLDENDIEVVVDESSTSTVDYLDLAGTPHRLRMPAVTLTRRAS